mmetsp:Transcript_40259/g.94316  ORF Transcript_40259/g.94316 Transcript_40259/m.94316 type:complete len:325 (+) Transcript_40259:406-1380(+)
MRLAPGVRGDVEKHQALRVSDELRLSSVALAVEDELIRVFGRSRVKVGHDVADMLDAPTPQLLHETGSAINEEVARLALRAVLVKVHANLGFLTDGEVVDHVEGLADDLKVLLYLLLSDLQKLAVTVVEVDGHLPNVVVTDGGIGPSHDQRLQELPVVLVDPLGVVAAPASDTREVVAGAQRDNAPRYLRRRLDPVLGRLGICPHHGAIASTDDGSDRSSRSAGAHLPELVKARLVSGGTLQHGEDVKVHLLSIRALHDEGLGCIQENLALISTATRVHEEEHVLGAIRAPVDVGCASNGAARIGHRRVSANRLVRNWHTSWRN